MAIITTYPPAKPIPFTAESIQAILAGRKTQTRRLIRPQPVLVPSEHHAGTWEWPCASHLATEGEKPTNGRYILSKASWAAEWPAGTPHNPQMAMTRFCPYGAAGGLLWARETYALVPRTAYAASEGVEQRVNPDDPNEVAIYKAGWTRSKPATRWRGGRFMFRWASRLTLRLTEVRVERLTDISEADVLAEGIPAYTMARGAISDNPPDPRWAYRALWDRINLTPSTRWDANPWCWVLSFERT